MAAFIDETIDSVLACDWPEVEIVLVDDGSTDPISIAKLDALEAAADGWPDGRVLRVLRGPNAGVAAARNKGAKAATGALMALLDADDIVCPDYYSRAINVLKSYDNLAFVGAWNEDFRDADGSTIRVWSTWNPEPPSQLIFNLTNCQGLIYWRDAFLEAGQHDPSLKMFLDDWESVISLMAAGLRGVEGVEFLHPPEANALFVAFPRDMHRRAHDAGAHYYMWPFDQSLEGPGDKMLSARLVCNWEKKDMDAFVAALKG